MENPIEIRGFSETLLPGDVDDCLEDLIEVCACNGLNLVAIEFDQPDVEEQSQSLASTMEAKYSRILSLDLSTKSGWAVFQDGILEKSGELEQVKVVNFNVNDKPWTQPEYPWNIMNAAHAISGDIEKLILQENPTFIVIENSVKGKNSQTQRLIEWFHFTVLSVIKLQFLPMAYMLPSAWRSAVNLRLSKDEKKNNREVSAGKKRGKITRKHLSVNMVNELYPELELILKHNDRADAILLGLGFLSTVKNEKQQMVQPSQSSL